MQWFVNVNARVEYEMTKRLQDRQMNNRFELLYSNKFWGKKLNFIEFV